MDYPFLMDVRQPRQDIPRDAPDPARGDRPAGVEYLREGERLEGKDEDVLGLAVPEGP